MIQLLAGGISAGSLYALVALGLMLTYRSTGVLNFAHGEMALVSTFVTFTLIKTLHVPAPLAIVIALFFSVVVGILVERIFIRPVHGKEELYILAVTIGLNTAFNSLVLIIWGADTLKFPVVFGETPMDLGGLLISRNHFWLIVVSVVSMAVLFAFMKYTTFGTAMRAVATDSKAAELLGIDLTKVFRVTWAASAILGTLAGMMIASVVFLNLATMENVLMKAFAVALLGGFGSLPGAVLGGLLLGVVENLTGAYLTDFKDVVPFLVIVVVLLIKPTGLLGGKAIEKV
ncbi:MAG: branched-chain amino acid ABC transporter permease [Chloroflexota bacterium]|nr:MAG: branched-chain amino acid ABC transporter permease [Chloroflexota bacterium]